MKPVLKPVLKSFLNVNFHLTIASLVLAGAATDSLAVDKLKARALFDNNGCASCHQPVESLVGPSLKDIAKRYKGK